MIIPNRDEYGNPIYAPTYQDNGGLQTVWDSKLYTCSAGFLSIFDEPITTQHLTSGGWYELMADPNSPQAIVGDYIEFAIVDKDDVLGLFSALGLTVGVDVLELGKFLRTEWVNPWASARRQEFTSNSVFELVPGLYLRTYYFSTGTNDVDVKVNFYVHET